MRLEGYSNYEIYPETGQVFSYKTNRFIGAKTDRGYWFCSLVNDSGKKWATQLHRIIWTAVNGEIPDGMQVNHIDENKDNNYISNLNLMTPKENTNWGTGIERAKEKHINNPKISTPIIGIKDGIIKKYFPSTCEAERQGFNHTNIYKCCKQLKRYKTHKGYQWRYLEDQLADWLEEIQDEDMKKERVA